MAAVDELTKRGTNRAFRHSMATHLLADEHDIRTVHELLGHSDVKTTMIHPASPTGEGMVFEVLPTVSELRARDNTQQPSLTPETGRRANYCVTRYDLQTMTSGSLGRTSTVES